MNFRILTEIQRLFDQLRTQGLHLTAMAGFDKGVRWITGQPSYHFGWVTPAILLGGQPIRRVWPSLLKQGITAVINLRYEYNYASDVAELPLNYLYLPTVDNTAPSLEHLIDGVRFITQHIARGEKIYIHCWEGLGRSPTLVAAYLVSNGMTTDEAWATIRNVRPFIRPTGSQKARLEEFEKTLNRDLPSPKNTQT
jgi:Dual specificity phosphatase, catalytic domain